MSKSKGNFTTFEDIEEKGYDAMDTRVLMLGAHYRSQMNFTWESLTQAKKNKEKLFGVYGRLRALGTEATRPVASEELDALVAALSDDLNTPLALAKALELATLQNKMLDANESINIDRALQDWQVIFQLFGLRYAAPSTDIPVDVTRLAELREAARAEKDFAKADEYRDQIEALGYTVKDTPLGFLLSAL